MSATQACLQLILLRSPRDAASDELAARILDAFGDGTEERAYVGGGEDLRVQVRELDAAPAGTAAEELDSALHTVVVALVGLELLGEPGVVPWLEACWQRVDDDDPAHALLLVPLDDGASASLLNTSPILAQSQLLDPRALGEQALRPAILALRVLHLARERLAAVLPATRGEPPGFLRMFISHAKGDGLPLAQSLGALIGQHDWMRSFYDARDIGAGTNWRRELRQGVPSSLLIVLRTSVYPTRHWCRQEVAWADEFAVPIVVVESRTGLLHPADHLPLSGGPGVSVPDGNLLRVLYLAMREGLRAQLFLRAVEELRRDGLLSADAKPLPRRPSSTAVLHACRALPDGDAHVIVYPDPPLGTEDQAVAVAIVATYAPRAVLTTPETLLAGGTA